MTCNYGGMYQYHARPLLFYPSMKYLHVLEHIVNVEAVETIFLIENPFYMTHWRIFIQS